MNFGDVEKLIPSALKIEINCDDFDFEMFVSDFLGDLRMEHNNRFRERGEIMNITTHNGCEADDFTVDYNNYNILIGDEIILSGKIDGSTDSYTGLLTIVDGVMESYHDKIIEKQLENEEKLQDLIAEERYEEAYLYLSFHGDERYFIYLKKLAEKYPRSSYYNKLKRRYRSRGNYEMFEKMNCLRRISGIRF